MKLRTMWMMGLAAVATISSSAMAQTSVTDEIDALKKRLADLEARQQLEKSVDAAKVDAKKRDSGVLGANLTYDRGFTFTSEDGNFKLTPTFELQFRYLLNSLDGDEDIRDGFDIRRASLILRGHAYNPDLKYYFKWVSSRESGSVSLESAYGQYKLNDQFQLRFGQWLSDLHREVEVSASRQVAVDRSLLNDVLGQGDLNIQQGVQLRYESEAEPVRGFIGLVDGQNSGNTPFTDVVSNYGVQGRVAYKFFGDWKEYADFSAMGIKKQLLVVGGGLDYSENDSVGPVNFDTVGVYRHTVDATFKDPGGLSLFGVYNGRFVDTEDDQSYDWGFLGQVAYAIPDTKWEPFGQFQWIDLDNAPSTVDEDSFYVVTVGSNYYYHKQNAKLTVDLSFLPNGSPKSSTSSGVFGSDEFQTVLRTQFQLNF
jgi:Phosphate-selective porin O and P